MILGNDYIFTNSIMEGYKNSLIISCKTTYRIKIYVNRIRKFHNFIGKTYIDVNQKDIQKYLAFLKDYEGNKYESLSRHLSTLRHFYKFLSIRGYIVVSPCNGIRIDRY